MVPAESPSARRPPAKPHLPDLFYTLRQGLSKLPTLVLHYSVTLTDFELGIFLPKPPE